MRKLTLFALAVLSVAAAACELALPFDRSLIPNEAGAYGLDGTLSDGEEDAPFEDSSPTPDARAPSGDAGDAAVGLDGPVGDGASEDASADGTSIVDAAGDGGEAGKASDAATGG